MYTAIKQLNLNFAFVNFNELVMCQNYASTNTIYMFLLQKVAEWIWSLKTMLAAWSSSEIDS